RAPRPPAATPGDKPAVSGSQKGGCDVQSGAVERTRTSTGFLPQAPQACASTSSATTAQGVPERPVLACAPAARGIPNRPRRRKRQEPCFSRGNLILPLGYAAFSAGKGRPPPVAFMPPSGSSEGRGPPPLVPPPTLSPSPWCL